MKFYLSHPIRGKNGNKAINKTIEANCLKAAQIAHYIRQKIFGIQIYVPGEHDLFVQLAYKNQYLTEKQILNIDCQIIDQCDGLLLYVPDDKIYGGCKIEQEHAIKTGKPVIIFFKKEEVIKPLKRLLND